MLVRWDNIKNALCLVVLIGLFHTAHSSGNDTSGVTREVEMSIEALQSEIAGRLSNRDVTYMHGKVQVWTSEPIRDGENCSVVWKSRQTDVSFPSKCILRKAMQSRSHQIKPTIEHERSTPERRGFRCDIGGAETISAPIKVVDTFDLRKAEKAEEAAYSVFYSDPLPRWWGVTRNVFNELSARVPEISTLIANKEIRIPPDPEAIEASPAVVIHCRDEEECFETLKNGKPLERPKTNLRIALPEEEEIESLQSAIEALVRKCGNEERSLGRKQ